MEFKDILKTQREALNLTLDDVGRYVGVSGATVSRWESGEIANIRRDKIAKLADILQVSPSYLMGWPEKVPSIKDERTETERKLTVLARHLDSIPEETRNRLIHNFSETIDMYLDAMGIPKDGE